MKSESLKKTKAAIIRVLDKLDINKDDKAELMLNLFILLDEKNYENDIKKLKRK